MLIFGSRQKGTGAESNTMAMSKWVSFCFLSGIHYWRQVWAASLQYYPTYSWFCDLSLYWDDFSCHQFLNKNLNISGTREDIQKKKTPNFFSLKGLLNKQKLFLIHVTLLNERCKIISHILGVQVCVKMGYFWTILFLAFQACLSLSRISFPDFDLNFQLCSTRLFKWYIISGHWICIYEFGKKGKKNWGRKGLRTHWTFV